MFGQDSNPYKCMFENFLKMNPMLCMMKNACHEDVGQCNPSCNQFGFGGPNCPIAHLCKMMSCCNPMMGCHPMMGGMMGGCHPMMNSCHPMMCGGMNSCHPMMNSCNNMMGSNCHPMMNCCSNDKMNHCNMGMGGMNCGMNSCHPMMHPMMNCCHPMMGMMGGMMGGSMNGCNPCHSSCGSSSCCDGYGMHKMMMEKYMGILCCLREFTEKMMCKMKECHKDDCNKDWNCGERGGEHFGNCCPQEWLKHIECKANWWSENFSKFHAEVVKLNEQAMANMKLISDNIKAINEQMCEYKKNQGEKSSMDKNYMDKSSMEKSHGDKFQSNSSQFNNDYVSGAEKKK